MAKRKQKKNNIKDDDKQQKKIINDLIGREEFVKKLVSVAEKVSTDKNWCFAIDGKWGAGKTFVFDLLTKELEGSPDFIIIKYDAWKNDFYDDPLIAILYCILDKYESMQGISVDIIHAIKNGISGFSVLLNEIPFVGKYKKIAEDILKELSKPRKKTTDNSIFKNSLSYQKLLDETKFLIKKAMGQKKLVLLVDEIDRCTPEYAMKVLERLHHLFEIENSITFVNINKAQLEKIILDKYIAEEKTNYFNKFFDLTFILPSDNEQNLIANLTEIYLSKNLDAAYNEDQLKFFKNMIYNEINDNIYSDLPREIKKAFDVFDFIANNILAEEKKFNLIVVFCFLSIKIKNNHNFLKNTKEQYKNRTTDFGPIISKVFCNKNKNYFEHMNYSRPMNDREYFTSQGFMDKKIIRFLFTLNLIFLQESENITILQRYYNDKTNYSAYLSDFDEIKKLVNKYSYILDLI